MPRPEPEGSRVRTASTGVSGGDESLGFAERYKVGIVAEGVCVAVVG